MSRTLHALIVGIDTYPHPDFHNLTRSKAFADAMLGFLQGLIKKNPRARLSHTLLKDRDATRQNIINGLKKMEAEAQPGDTCLFYFAGHGSQELAPIELCGIDDDDLFETLVCYDSRMGPGKFDLADKELAYLIAQINKHDQVHFTTIMDCCHAGDNNRENEFDRSISSVVANMTERRATEFLGHHTFRSRSPEPKSIELAACQPNESAGNGTFSEFLLPVLNSTNLMSASYDAILKAVKDRGIMRRGQTPGIFPPNSPLRNRPFLNGILVS